MKLCPHSYNLISIKLIKIRCVVEAANHSQSICVNSDNRNQNHKSRGTIARTCRKTSRYSLLVTRYSLLATRFSLELDSSSCAPHRCRSIVVPLSSFYARLSFSSLYSLVHPSTFFLAIVPSRYCMPFLEDSFLYRYVFSAPIIIIIAITSHHPVPPEPKPKPKPKAKPTQ